MNNNSLLRCILILLIFMGFSNPLRGQESGTQEKPVRSTALIKSAIVPGWGQVYNGKITKGALIATAQTYMGFQFIRWNKKLQYTYDGNERRHVKNRRNIWALGFAAGSVLSMADAYTDAWVEDLPEEDKPSPGVALLRSALLPGWGQLHNDKVIKGAVVFSVHAYMGYQFFLYNDKLQDATDKNRKDHLEYTRNTWGWRFLAGYLLNLADAFVDAQLAGFPEDESLTVNIQPLTDGWFMNVSVEF